MNDIQTQPPPPTPAHAPVAAREKYGWAVGAIAENTLVNGLVSLAQPIFNIGLGISNTWLMWAMAIPRALDAILDPLIGNLSDNTRSRWGRRRPFIFGGILVSALAFIALWFPYTGWSKTGLGIHFFVCTAIMFLGFAFFSIGFSALGFELTPDSTERTRIIGLKMLFANVAGLVIAWMYRGALWIGTLMEEPPANSLVAGMQNFSHWLSGLMGDQAAGGVLKEVVGIRYVGLAVGLLVLATGLLPVLLCREKGHGQTQAHVPLGRALRLTLGCRPFLMLSAIMLCVLIGCYIITPLSLYIGIYYICGGVKETAATIGAVGGNLFSLTGIIMSPLSAMAGARWGKKPVVIVGIGLMIFGYLTSWVLYTPHYPWLSMVPAIIIGLGSTGVFLLCGAMLADICDLDDLENGLRREGMFGAVLGTVMKGAIAAVTGLGSIILIISGFKENMIPTAHTLFMMRLLYLLFPVILLTLALLLALIYPINERRVREIRTLLDARDQEAARKEKEEPVISPATVV